MKVEIVYAFHPAYDMLYLYEVPSGLRPICSIWENDFCELLSESEYKRFESGSENTIYHVKKSKLWEKAKKIYPLY